MTSNVDVTVDSNELEYFNKLSSSWWGPATAILLAMNKLRIPFIHEGLVKTGVIKEESSSNPQPLKNLLILDVGCGGGYLSEELSKLGCTVVGLDMASELIDIAKAHAELDPSLTNLSYILQSLEEHVLSNAEKYDVVIASEVIEHVADKNVFVENCVKCLKPGGSMFITTFSKTWSSWLIGKIYYEYISNVIPRGAHQWEKFITPEDTTTLLEKYMCKTVNVRGHMYSAIFKNWYSIPVTWLCYALQAVKI